MLYGLSVTAEQKTRSFEKTVQELADGDLDFHDSSNMQAAKMSSFEKQKEKAATVEMPANLRKEAAEGRRECCGSEADQKRLNQKTNFQISHGRSFSITEIIRSHGW